MHSWTRPNMMRTPHYRRSSFKSMPFPNLCNTIFSSLPQTLWSILWLVVHHTKATYVLSTESNVDFTSMYCTNRTPHPSFSHPPVSRSSITTFGNQTTATLHYSFFNFTTPPVFVFYCPRHALPYIDSPYHFSNHPPIAVAFSLSICNLPLWEHSICKYMHLSQTPALCHDIQFSHVF